MHPLAVYLHYQLLALYFQGASTPGQGLLNSVVAFITGPFGKGVTLIAIVICGVSYMYGQKSDNSVIARTAIGAAIIVGAANIWAYIQSAG
jgi:type IV secretory pathway VirB2 component (pilin)